MPGSTAHASSDLRGGGAAENAKALRALFAGEAGAYRDIVLLNAAAALMVAERATDIMAGAEPGAASCWTAARRGPNWSNW